eukprot:CAMPEP_0194370144 /NCGR_PEP_ID=MMETSP0174-20130528/18452_1 /TAXON_ID=216777 /ORGANISM="Proboscia alata, Strain PI-D3" /LENGTH=756 /DNA_ID=CAMNT_0039147445 /DNA_START=28 /DNA_END=2298 /DNA_ORIENTATION=-
MNPTNSTKPVKLVHSKGTSTIMVTSGISMGQFARLIESAISNIPSDNLVLKTGYPPKPIPSCHADDLFGMNYGHVIHVSASDASRGILPTVTFAPSAKGNNDYETDDNAMVPNESDQSCTISSKTNYTVGSSHDFPFIIDDDDDVNETNVEVCTTQQHSSKPRATIKKLLHSPCMKRPRSSYENIHKESSTETETQPQGTNTHTEKRSLLSPFKLFASLQHQQRRRACESSSTSNNNAAKLFPKNILTLREMLGFDDNIMEPSLKKTSSRICWIVVCNFLIDFDFLLQEVPELVSVQKAIFFYGSGDPSSWNSLSSSTNNTVEFHRLNPSEEPSSPSYKTANPLKYKFPFGCHHTKMFLVGFDDGRLRVIVHTANLQYGDIYLKTQGAYLQDFFPKRNTTTSISAGKPTYAASDFEDTLVEYLESYGHDKLYNWRENNSKEPKQSLTQHLRNYDFSAASVILIPSCPGYYSMPNKCKRQGYLKLKDAIAQHSNAKDSESPVVCQFSSIGSFSEKWLSDFVACLRQEEPRKHLSKDNVILVFPTTKDIRDSIEGYRGGNSVPARAKNVKKSFLRPLYSKWTSSSTTNINNPYHQPQNVPHIKTYYMLSNDSSNELEWFVLTSHNLSKAAWGEVQKGKYGFCFKILSWELGVYCASSLLNFGKTSFSIPTLVSANESFPFPIKHDLVTEKCDSSTSKSRQPRRLVISSGVGNLSEEDVEIPLPYTSRPQSYHYKDDPWAVDLQYSSCDSFGRYSASDL